MTMYLRLLLTMWRGRRLPRMDAWDTAVSRFRVRLLDIDIFRHMTNARYLAFMDLGRTELLMRSGLWQQIRDRDWYPVVASQMITYRRSLNLWRPFALHTRLLGVEGQSIYIEQWFEAGGEVVARAVVRGRFLGPDGSIDIADVVALGGEVPQSRVVPPWAVEWANAARMSEGRFRGDADR